MVKYNLNTCLKMKIVLIFMIFYTFLFSKDVQESKDFLYLLIKCIKKWGKEINYPKNFEILYEKMKNVGIIHDHSKR